MLPIIMTGGKMTFEVKVVQLALSQTKLIKWAKIYSVIELIYTSNIRYRIFLQNACSKKWQEVNRYFSYAAFKK